MSNWITEMNRCTGPTAEMSETQRLRQRILALEAALREGLNLQGRWPLDKKLYPDEAAWIAHARALLHDSQEKDWFEVLSKHEESGR